VKTGRVEAFSDGVIAVIITIMVLEVKVPHVGTRQALLAVVPSLLVYGLSFAVVAIMCTAGGGGLRWGICADLLGLSASADCAKQSGLERHST